MPSFVTAQVIIKEKVEIKPKTNDINSQNIPTEPTFLYILSWTPDQYRRGKIQIISCYGDTTDSGWTSEGFATTTVPGRGHHIFNFINERWYYDSHYGWGWYYDSNPDIERKVLVSNQELNLGSILGSTMGTIGTQLLNLEDFICDSGFVKMKVVPKNWANCGEIGWFPTDPIDLRIIQGEEFASFFNIQTGMDLGNTVLIDPFVRIEDLHFFFGPEWDKDGLENIAIMPKDSNYTLPFTVVVEANINEVTFSTEIEFVPKSFVIDASLYPEAITMGEQSSFYINVSALCSGLPFETRINVEIIKGQKYGSLIDPYTNENTKILTNLDHWFGNVWLDYIADGTSSEDVDSVILKVTTTDPAIAPKEAILIIKPPPIYVYTVPGVVEAADTAEVIIKKRNSDGSLEDFPLGQTFELAVLDGCVNGNILFGDSLGVYFSDAQRPIYFVAADSVEGDSGVVRLRVGAELGGSSMKPLTQGDEKNEKLTDEQTRMSELKAGYKKMIEEKKAAVIESKSDLNGEQPSEAPIIEVCYYGSYLYETGYWEGDVVVKQDECDEEIVVCDSFEPQKFEEVGTITVLGENDTWQWKDENDSLKTTSTGNACDEGKHNSCDSVNFGKTYLMQEIGKYSPGNLIYSLNEDMKVSVCSDQRITSKHLWQFNVDNIRVPIFTSFCYEEPDNCNWINLGDGTDTTVLSQNIKSCKDFDKIMDVIDWWKIGPYYNAKNNTNCPSKIYFSFGIMKHEEHHVTQNTQSVLRFLNDGDSGLVVLRNEPFLPEKSKYSCPDEVIKIYKKVIKNRLNGMIKHAVNLKNFSLIENGQWKFELDADVAARIDYETISSSIKNWAKLQNWWCSNGSDCLSNNCP
ncbi:MAG: hypothetical protein IT276_05790 [Ignavibacteriaceae bacterium]|nr:hypothetical protein [Ignavibacteriaceae bacterium]